MFGVLPAEDDQPQNCQQPVNGLRALQKFGCEWPHGYSDLDFRARFVFSTLLVEPILFGKLSRYVVRSFSVNEPGSTCTFVFSLAVRLASCCGSATMCGVRKIISSVLPLSFAVCLKRFPSSGIAERYGILLSVCALEFCIMPPMITVWPFGTTTTVSATRELMTGASAPPEIGTHWLRSARPDDSGETIISTMPSEVMNGVTRRMIPTLV